MNKEQSRRDFLKTTGKGLVTIPAALAIANAGFANEEKKKLHFDKNDDNNLLQLNVRDFGATPRRRKTAC